MDDFLADVDADYVETEDTPAPLEGASISVSLQYEPQEMIDAIVSKAAAILARDISGHLTETIRRRVSEQIDAQLSKIVDDAMNREITPVNQWGEPNGKPASVRDMITTKAERFMLEHVDSDGRACNSYNGKPRVDWAVSKVVTATLDSQTRSEIKKITDEAKANIAGQVGAMIAAIVSKP